MAIRYSSGKPCVRGHISERYTKGNRCCACAIDNMLKWRLKHPAIARVSMRNGRRKYLKYPEPLYPPPGCCEICGTTDNGKNDWNLDHNHVTGAFRGWLCSRCNGALGMLKDDPDLIDKAAAYLRARNHNGQPG